MLSPPRSEVFDAAAPHLPALLRWASLLTVWGAVAACAALATALALRPAVRRYFAAAADGAHWTERARLRYPAQALALVGVYFGAAFGGTWSAGWVGPLSAVPLRGALAIGLVAGGGAALLVGMAMLPSLPGREIGVRRSLRSMLAVWLLFFPGLLVPGLGLVLLPYELGPGLALGMALLALVLGWLLHGGVLPVLRLFGLSRDADPAVQERVDAACSRASLPAARCEVVGIESANAFVLPLADRVLLTDALLEVLTPEQLDSVLDHEAGHLADSTASKRAFALRGFLILPFVATPALYSAYGFLGIGAVIVPVILLSMLARRSARSMEDRADAAARERAADPAVYAHALEAIHRFNEAPAVLHAKLPHPALYDRMESAGVTPDYPRPEPPAQHFRAKLLLLGITMLPGISRGLLANHAWDQLNERRDPTLVLLLEGGSSWSLLETARLYAVDAHPGALPVARLAASVGESEPWVRCAAGLLLVDGGAVEEAWEEYEAAHHLGAGVDDDLQLALEMARLGARLAGTTGDAPGAASRADRAREAARAQLEAKAVLAEGEEHGANPWLTARLAELAFRLGDEEAEEQWLVETRARAAELDEAAEIEDWLAALYRPDAPGDDPPETRATEG